MHEQPLPNGRFCGTDLSENLLPDGIQGAHGPSSDG